MEYEQLLFLLTSNKSTYIEIENRDKGTILVKVHVKPVDNKKGTSFRGIIPVEIINNLDENDMQICSNVITKAINGLHWKAPKKGYYKYNHMEYYLRPDWKYWYSLRDQV